MDDTNQKSWLTTMETAVNHRPQLLLAAAMMADAANEPSLAAKLYAESIRLFEQSGDITRNQLAISPQK